MVSLSRTLLQTFTKKNSSIGSEYSIEWTIFKDTVNTFLNTVTYDSITVNTDTVQRELSFFKRTLEQEIAPELKKGLSFSKNEDTVAKVETLQQQAKQIKKRITDMEELNNVFTITQSLDLFRPNTRVPSNITVLMRTELDSYTKELDNLEKNIKNTNFLMGLICRMISRLELLSSYVEGAIEGARQLGSSWAKVAENLHSSGSKAKQLSSIARVHAFKINIKALMNDWNDISNEVKSLHIAFQKDQSESAWITALKLAS